MNLMCAFMYKNVTEDCEHKQLVEAKFKSRIFQSHPSHFFKRRIPIVSNGRIPTMLASNRSTFLDISQSFVNERSSVLENQESFLEIVAGLVNGLGRKVATFQECYILK